MKKIIIFVLAFVLVAVNSCYALDIVRLGPGYFPETSRGRPIALGKIYVGIPDLDPTVVSAQKTLSVRQEDGTVVEVTQPVLTNAGGVPVYLGAPVTLLVSGDYSLKVLDSSDVQVYYVPTSEQSDDFSYPDATAADQGVTGDSNTLKYYIDTINAIAPINTAQATIVLRNNSGEATTTYTLTTSETIPANITLKVERGAIIGGGGTLTINGDLEAGSYHVFNGTVIFGPGALDYAIPIWYNIIHSDNTVRVANTTALEKALAVGSGVNTMRFPASGVGMAEGGTTPTYYFESFTLPGKVITLESDGHKLWGPAILNFAPTGTIAIDASDNDSRLSRIEGFEIYGGLTKTAIYVDNNGLHLSNIHVNESNIALHIVTSVGGTYERLSLYGDQAALFLDASGASGYISNNSFYNVYGTNLAVGAAAPASGDFGLQIDGSLGIVRGNAFINTDWSNCYDGVMIDVLSISNSFIGTWFEANEDHNIEYAGVSTNQTDSWYDTYEGVTNLATASVFPSKVLRVASGTITTRGLVFQTPFVNIADANTLDDYEEYTAADTACTGALIVSVVWKATKIGNTVTLTLPATQGANQAAMTTFTYGVVLPASFRPSSQLQFVSAAVTDNSAGVATPGAITINIDGTIVVYVDGLGTTNWTNAGNCGINTAVSISWSL